jgi:hypothetical protein
MTYESVFAEPIYAFGYRETTPVDLDDVVQIDARRTLADIDDSPPAPLLLDMIEPDGPNLLNASGGVGKGMTAAWMIRELLGIGIKPMIYDVENRPREWARRCSGLGVDRRQVEYRQTRDLPTNLLGQPLWDIAPHLGRVAKASGSDLLIIDSVMPAVGVGEERLKSDGQAPYLYVGALDDLGIPSVSLSHPPKGQPDGDPFGSVAWVNAMRLTWQGTRAESYGHRVRWRPRKRNERGRIAGVLLSFGYDQADRLCDAVREDDDEVTRDWILGALLNRSRTVQEMSASMLEEMDEPPTPELVKRTENRLDHALRRMDREGWVGRAGKAGSANLWALAGKGQI